MAERIANNLQTFESDINDYNNHLQNLISHFSNLITHMNALNSMWEGESHDEFIQKFNIDRENTQIMIDDLKKILDELRFAHSQYSDCERNVASMIDQISI